MSISLLLNQILKLCPILSAASKPKSEEESDRPRYVYDERGLRVRSGSISTVQEIKQVQDMREKTKSQLPSDVDVLSLILIAFFFL